jgi:hypothetical protein
MVQSNKTPNQLLHDAVVRHQVFLLRSAGVLQRKVVEALQESEARIKLAIVEHPRRNRLELMALLAAVTTLRRQAWRKVSREWLASLAELTAREPMFLTDTLNEVAPIVIQITPLKNTDTIVTQTAVMGKTAQEWFDDAEASDIDRIETSIRWSDEKEDSDRVLLALLFGMGGLATQTERGLSTITATALMGLTSAVAMDFFALNTQLAMRWLFVAVLDNRTTPLCRSLSGKTYLIGKGPIPPLHWYCRSRAVPFVNLKNWGGVPRSPSYAEWLGGQSVQFQDEILGPTRGRLFRSGGVTLARFVDYNTGKQFTLEELAKREGQS